ncbi:hypothetical protein ACYCAX_11875 [Pseudomonas sp. MT3]
MDSKILIGVLGGGFIGSFFGVAGLGGAVSGMIPGAIIGALVVDWLRARSQLPQLEDVHHEEIEPEEVDQDPDGYSEWLVKFKHAAIRQNPDLANEKNYMFDLPKNRKNIKDIYKSGMGAESHGFFFGNHTKGEED